MLLSWSLICERTRSEAQHQKPPPCAYPDNIVPRKDENPAARFSHLTRWNLKWTCENTKKHALSADPSMHICLKIRGHTILENTSSLLFESRRAVFHALAALMKPLKQVTQKTSEQLNRQLTRRYLSPSMRCQYYSRLKDIQDPSWWPPEHHNSHIKWGMGTKRISSPRNDTTHSAASLRYHSNRVQSSNYPCWTEVTTNWIASPRQPHEFSWLLRDICKLSGALAEHTPETSPTLCRADPRLLYATVSVGAIATADLLDDNQPRLKCTATSIHHSNIPISRQTSVPKHLNCFGCSLQVHLLRAH